MTRNVDMEYFNGKAETRIKEIISKISGTDMGKCIGQMDHITKGSGIKVIYTYNINIGI